MNVRHDPIHHEVGIPVTPDMEGLMDEEKRMFYDSTQSEMIRALIVAGLTALKTGKEPNSTLKVGEKSEENRIVG